MKRIIDRVKFENRLRERIKEQYIHTSTEELNFNDIIGVFEDCEE